MLVSVARRQSAALNAEPLAEFLGRRMVLDTYCAIAPRTLRTIVPPQRGGVPAMAVIAASIFG